MLGAEQVIMALCRHSSDFGYESFLAVTHDRGDPVPQLHTAALESGLDSRLLACGHKFDMRAIGALRRMIESLQIDVLHCHGYREDFYAVMSRASVARVTTNHLWKRTTRALRFYAAADSMLIRRFDRVIAVSREIFEELTTQGLEAPQLAYIPNGVDVERFAAAVDPSVMTDRRARLGLGDSGLVMATISSLTEEKGHEYLLRSLASLKGRMPEYKLLIVGDGPRESNLRALAAELGLSGMVEFLGRREDIPEILTVADVFVLPSLIEGFPIALLEAMAAGKACVATDVGDVAQAIEDGVTGALVPPADTAAIARALERLAGDETMRRQVSANAQQRVIDRYSSARMSEAYCKLYDDIRSRPAQSGG